MPGLFARLLGREKRAATGGQVLASAYAGYHAAGGAVTPVQAETIGSVTACVSLIRNTLSSLPVQLSQDADRGRQEAPASALGWRLLRRPTAFLSWPAFIGMAASQLLLRGNFLCVIDTDRSGRPMELRPVPWDRVMATMLPTGRIAYDVHLAGYPYGPAGSPRRYLQDQVLHVRLQSDDGIVGKSVLARAPGPLAEAAEIETLALSNWQHGMRPSAVLTSPSYLQDNQRARFSDSWLDRFSGSIAAGRIPLIEGGWSLQTLQLKSVDQEFLGSRLFAVAEVCRLFGIPEILLQMDRRSIADPQPFVSQFVTQALNPIIAAIEAEWDFSLLPDGQHLTIDTSGLVRGHFSTVAAGFSALVQSGIATANDARVAMGFAPVAGGDLLRTSGAPNYPPDTKNAPSLAPKPGPTGDGVALPSHQNQGRGNGQMVQ